MNHKTSYHFYLTFWNICYFVLKFFIYKMATFRAILKLYILSPNNSQFTFLDTTIISYNVSFSIISSTFLLSCFISLSHVMFFSFLLVTHIISHVAVSKHCHSVSSVPSVITSAIHHNAMLGLLCPALLGVSASSFFF